VAVIVSVALGVAEGEAEGEADGVAVGVPVAVAVAVTVGTRLALVVLLLPQAEMKNENAAASGRTRSRGKMPFMMYLQEASPLMLQLNPRMN
jgi:hypothetical protein